MRNWIYMEEEEDTPIRTFGEGDNQDTTPADVEEAEEDIEEKEAEHELRMHWLATYGKTGLEYATPSGSDPVGGNCQGGCADAGDTVIVESEIVDAPDADSDDGEDLGEDLTVDDSGDEESTEDEVEMMRALDVIRMEANVQFPMSIQMAGFGSTSKAYLVKAFKMVGRGALKLLDKSAKLTCKVITYLLARVVKANKIWKFKLYGMVEKIDNDKLDNIYIKAVPERDWVEVVKLSMVAYNMLKNCDKYIFDRSSDSIPSDMKRLASNYADLGIRIHTSKSGADYDHFLDKSVKKKILQLGYDKSRLENYNRYLGNITNCIDKKSKAAMSAKLERVTKELIERAVEVRHQVASGSIKADSADYRKELESIANFTVRLNFILSLNTVVFTVFNLAVKDMISVFNGFADAKR